MTKPAGRKSAKPKISRKKTKTAPSDKEEPKTLALSNTLAIDATETRVQRIAQILDDLKSEEILALDLRGVADYADFFLIATMRSRPQMRAACVRISETLKAEGARPFSPPEDESPNWTILDYGDVVVHLFTPDARQHYALEQIWGDAGEFDWRNGAEA
jgi:ribosome-associated protein